MILYARIPPLPRNSTLSASLAHVMFANHPDVSGTVGFISFVLVLHGPSS